MARAVGTVLAIAAIFTGNPWITLAAVAANGIAAQQERRKAERSARDAYNASLHDRTMMVRGTVEPRELVLGRVRKSGQLYPVGSIGTNNEKFVFIVLLAGHEIDAVEQVWFNETQLTLDSSGYVQTAPYLKGETLTDSQTITVSGGPGSLTLPHVPIAGSVTASRYDYTQQLDVSTTPSVAGAVVTISDAGDWRVGYQYTLGTPKARVTWALGTSTQAASARLLTLFPSKWTSAHQLQDIAYLVVELDYDQDAFPTGLPTVSAVIRGAKVYDPRSNTTAWAENPALQLRAAATHPLCGRLNTAYMDDAAIAAAATVCDTSTAYVVTGVGTTTRARYTAGTVIRSDQQPQQGITELLSAMSGRMSFAGGKLRIKTGYTAPVAAIDADWFAPGPVQYTPSVPRQDLKNIVQGTHVDGGGKWQVVPFTRQVDSSSVASDGAELAQDLTLGAVTFGPQAQQVAANLLRESRNSATFAATFNLRAYALEALDTVTLTLDHFGLAAKAFEIVERAYTADAGITLTLRETDASFYALGSSFVQPASTANTTLPQPWNVAAPGSLTVQSGTNHLLRQSDGTIVSRMWVTWPAITDAAVLAGGHIEVAYTLGASTLPAGAWPSVTVPGDAPGAYITPVQDDRAYLVKARCITATPVRSPWGAQIAHLVIGKSAAPTDVAGVTATVVQGGVRVSWTPNAELDYADTDLRIGATWSSATPLFRGTANTYTWPWPAAGSYTLSIKHRDTSGNVSASAATVSFTVDAAILVQWANLGAKPADTDLLNTHTQGSVLVVNHPAGGNYSNSASSQTGAIKIRLPQSWTDTMLRFFVEVYEYSSDRSFTIEIGGYNGAGTNWAQCYARMTGSAAAEKSVRFGHDGTRCCVWIGEPGSNWEYPQVTVTNFRAAYNNYAQAQWAAGWQISLDTSAVAGHAVNYTQANPLTGASWAQIPAGTGKASDNATVGATWGSNLSGQPADSALLNALQTWAQVGGAGKPADNATVGATFGTNITGQAATTDIQDNAVTYTAIYSDATGVSVCPTC